MSLPVLEFTIVPDSISVYNESSGMYIYQVFGVFESAPDCFRPIDPYKVIKVFKDIPKAIRPSSPIMAISSNEHNRFGEVLDYNHKHTRSTAFTLALDEYGDDDFTNGGVQSMYVSLMLSDWYYQRCKNCKTMTVEIFDVKPKQFIGIFDFKDFIFIDHTVKINTKQTINHIIAGRISYRNYDRTFTDLINTFSDIVDNEDQLKVYIRFR